MKESNKYRFWGKVSLEYRLSLGNLCKLMMVEETEENKKMIYDGIMENAPLKNEFNYLFYYETLGESEDVSKDSYSKALKFLNSYIIAKRANKNEEAIQILKELSKTDHNFESLKGKTFEKPLTEEEATIITKYRIKYRISRVTIADAFNVGEKKLLIGEEKINDKILLKKLKSLSNFFIDADNQKRRKAATRR